MILAWFIHTCLRHRRNFTAAKKSQMARWRPYGCRDLVIQAVGSGPVSFHRFLEGLAEVYRNDLAIYREQRQSRLDVN